MEPTPRYMIWKARRVLAGYRQLDIALALGISAARYSLIERGEAVATEIEVSEIERILPPLPTELVTDFHDPGAREAERIST